LELREKNHISSPQTACARGNTCMGIVMANDPSESEQLLHFSETWPQRDLFVQVYHAVRQFIGSLQQEVAIPPSAGLLPPM
jgi:hypothetical protein